MEPSAATITPIIVGVLTALIPALYTYLHTSNRKARARARALEVQSDERDANLIQHRAALRLHNDEHHPTGEGAVPLPDLPAHMTRTDEDE